MPLLKRKPYIVQNALPADLKPDEQVFVVRVTGEVVREYEEYLAKVHLYRTRHWTCQYTGKTNLTYEEAIREEQNSSALLQKFPPDLEASSLQIVHFSTLRLEDLINQIHSLFKPTKAPGKENASDTPSQKISKPVIRRWLFEVAEQHNKLYWVVKDEYVKRYNLPQHPSDDLQRQFEDLERNKGQGTPRSPFSPPKSATKPSPSKKTVIPLADSTAVNIAQPFNEDEYLARLKPGTMKHSTLLAMRNLVASRPAAITQGYSIEEIITAVVEAGWTTEWTEGNRKNLYQVLSAEPVFVKLGKGIYTLKKALVPLQATLLKTQCVRKRKTTGQEGAAATEAKNAEAAEGPQNMLVDGQTGSADGKRRRSSGDDEGVDEEKRMSIDKLTAGPEDASAAVIATTTPEPENSKPRRPSILRPKPLANRSFDAETYVTKASKKSDGGAGSTKSMPGKPKVRVSTEVLEGKGAVKSQAETDNANATNDAAKVDGVSPLKHMRKGLKLAEGGEKASLEKKAGDADGKDKNRNSYEVAYLKAQRAFQTASNALKAHQNNVTELEAREVELANKVAAAEESLKSPRKPPLSDADILAMEGAPREAMDPEELVYKGDPDDRHSLMAFKRKVVNMEKELRQQKESWVIEQRRKQKKEVSAVTAAANAIINELRDVRATLARSRGSITSSMKAVEAAREMLQRRRAELDMHKQATQSMAAEQVRAEHKKQVLSVKEQEREKERREREEAREKERLERERRRQEALNARRYPIDDLELLEELKQSQGGASLIKALPLPERIPSDDAMALLDGMYVSDFVTQFQKVLGMRTLTLGELDSLIAGGPAEKPLGQEVPSSGPGLSQLYKALLTVLLEDIRAAGVEGRREARWSEVLEKHGIGSWPEVLRRYSISRHESGWGYSKNLVGFDVVAVLTFLSEHEVEEVSRTQHLTLLRFLVDEVLDTELMRNALQARQESASSTAAEVRADIAEERRKLKEMVDAEREAKKRRREELVAAAAGTTAEEGGEGAAQDPSKRAKVAEAPVEVPEPVWTLPEEFEEYKGDPNDRKGLLIWRQAAAAARTKLDKERAAWQAEQRRRMKEVEAARRSEVEEERRRAKEKRDAEDALLSKQEAFERDMEKFIIRRTPLGMDRYHRMYWWALGSVRTGVLVQEDESIRELQSIKEVEELIAVLDIRGVREKELKAALEKAHPSILNALRKAGIAKTEGTDAGVSKRERQMAARVMPSRAAKKGTVGGAEDEELASSLSSELLGPFQLSAASDAFSAIRSVSEAAARAGAQAPASGWEAWRESLAVAAILRPDGKAGSEKDELSLDVAAKVLSALRERLLELELSLVGLTGEDRLLALKGDGSSDVEAGNEPAAAAADSASSEDEDNSDADGGAAATVEPGAEPSEAAIEEEGYRKMETPSAKPSAAKGDDQEDAEERSARIRGRLSNVLHPKSATLDAPTLEDDAPEIVESNGEANSSPGAQAAHPERRLWRSAGEHKSWRDAVMAAKTFARVAYCAATLEHVSLQPLEHMKTAKKKKVKR